MEPSIIIRNLTKSFGDKQVLKGVDLEVSPGAILGYIGPNGAGKTTTVKILIGMLGDFEGEVSVCGHDIRTDTLEVKRRIGYVPESAAMYDLLTPMEYLRFVGSIHGMDAELVNRRTKQMLEMLGLENETENRMNTFSKGMRQKVLIAAGMLHDPDVLFLDEPLSGLDANSAVMVKEIVSELARRGKTVFYCSHVMDVVERVCDRIVIVSDGKIVADGSFEELQSQDKGASLERIFTELTSDGGQDTMARRFVNVFDDGQEND